MIMEEHERPLTGGKFAFVTMLNISITVVEIVGGLLAGSLALVTDAIHNFGDSLSIVLSYSAQRIGQRDQDERATFGYHRVEILTAFVNSLVLILISIVLVWEGIQRLLHQQPINGYVMFWTALISFSFNMGSALLMHADSRGSLNIKATYLHLLADALASIAVIIGSLMVLAFHIYWIDAALTIVVSLYIIYETVDVVKQTSKILLQNAPVLDYDAIIEAMTRVPGVVDVHHLHAWMEDEKDIIFSAHVNITPDAIEDIEWITAQETQLLQQRFNICHVTVQIEITHGLNSAKFAKHEML
ncbi:Cobalt-zinc-cadmium resistance protein CzcD [Furfurilactobacillus rossiae]|nr:Cobalt-zinc-cadmium resistance protein CzcD [Furfurilactobacillus rossiae]